MKLIVGLWNPGEKYKLNRHNIGFIVVDWVAEYFWFTQFLFNKKFNSFVCTGKIWKRPIIIIKPQTFMNLSWEAVSKVVNFYKIDLKDILVVHDDLDLPLWKIKLKFNWSSWWHNGVKDIIKHLKTDKFWRLKIGIGRPESKEMVINYVLSDFKKDELSVIEEKKQEILKKIEEWLKYSW